MAAASTPRAHRALVLGGWIALLVGAAPVRADEGAASVHGSVTLLRRSLIGGLREHYDRSGVVVYVTGFASEAPQQVALLNQRDETFEPRVLPVVQGQSVSFPNQDPIYHNVFSVSPLATFDLGQYKASDEPRSVTFDRAGLVPVYCNIHPQMLSYVVVLENDAFAVTAADGRFVIEGLPAGRDLVLHAWTPGAQRVSQPLRIAAGQTIAIDLRVEQTERIAPHKRKDGSAYPRKPTKSKYIRD